MHNSTGYTRFVDFDPTFARLEEWKVGVTGGASYGPALTDVGNTAGSVNIEAGPVLRTRYFSAGWIPYHGNSQVSQDDTNNFGSLLFASAHLGGGDEWKFDLQQSYSYALNRTHDEGNDKDNTIYFCIFTCKTADLSSAKANVDTKVKEWGTSFTATKHLAEKHSISFTPTVYRTFFESSNQLTGDSTGDFFIKRSRWNYAFMVTYLNQCAEKASLMISAGAAYNYEMTVREKGLLVPQAGVRFIF